MAVHRCRQLAVIVPMLLLWNIIGSAARGGGARRRRAGFFRWKAYGAKSSRRRFSLCHVRRAPSGKLRGARGASRAASIASSRTRPGSAAASPASLRPSSKKSSTGEVASRPKSRAAIRDHSPVLRRRFARSAALSRRMSDPLLSNAAPNSGRRTKIIRFSPGLLKSCWRISRDAPGGSEEEHRCRGRRCRVSTTSYHIVMRVVISQRIGRKFRSGSA